MQGSWKERGALIPSQMLKGVLQGSVLAILGQRETYGYEIVQALHGYGFGSVSEGTIYPLLLRLEKEGWVSARFMDSDGSLIHLSEPKRPVLLGYSGFW